MLNQFNVLFQKGIMSLKTEGIRYTFHKCLNYKRKINLQNVSTQKDWCIEDLLNQKFRSSQPISIIETINLEKRVNIVTDSIDKDSLFGGVATSLIIATEFANKYNIPLRVITRTTPANPIAYYNIMEISEVKAARHISFYSDYDRDLKGRKNFKLETSKNDIFIATSWWSALAIRKTFPEMHFFYVLQEVETFFYPHGDEHYWCSQMMEDTNITYIVNSQLLFEYFKNNNENVFPPVVSWFLINT